MQKLHKKFNVLNKKQQSFGLTAEEEIRFKEIRAEWWALREELIEAHLETSVYPYLLTQDAKDAVGEIQKLVPWHGKLILRDEDMKAVSDTEKNLTDDQKDFIAEKLDFVHRTVLDKFEEFCDTDEGWDYMNDVSKVLTNSDQGDIVEVTVYLDARYREFGELLGIHLDDVEIYFEGDENLWKKD